MEDTHFVQPKIMGYRQLSQEEADLMNEAKALGQRFDALVKRQQELLYQQATTKEGHERHMVAEPFYWLDAGRRSVQIGIMQVVRAIAQPTV